MNQVEQTVGTNQMDSWLASLLEAREKRGIIVDPVANERFIKVRRTVMGFNELVEAGEEPRVILDKLSQMNPELLGFALEGVGMALTKKNLDSPNWHKHVEAFVEGTSITYQVMVFLGVGALLATDKLPVYSYIKPYLEPFNPIRVWAILDGYGFQCGMLHWQDFLYGQPKPEELSGYDGRVFDQGLGRSIWVIDSGDITRVPKTISTFALNRQPDLWCGIGYVCSSVGAAKRESLEELGKTAGPFLPALAQGAASAAKFRRLLGTAAAHVEMAHEVLSQMVAKTNESGQSAFLSLPTIDSTPIQALWKFYRSYFICD